VSAVHLPDNPCDRKTVEGCAWDVLIAAGAFMMPVSRDRVLEDVQTLYRARNPNGNTTLASVDKLLRVLAQTLDARTDLGWRLVVPKDDKGVRLDGRVKLVQS
jgi:hypothetical protein